MQDRLNEFQRMMGNDGHHNNGGDIEMGTVAHSGGGGGQQSAQLQEFYREVDLIKEKLQTIENNIAVLNTRFGESLEAVTAQKTEAAMRDMEKIVAETNRISQDVSARLKGMQAQIADDYANSSAPEARIHQSIHSALAKKFYDLMSEYQALKTSNAQRYRARVRHQAEIAVGEAPTEAQLDELIAGGQPNRLFADRVLNDKRHEDAAHALAFITERHNDLVRLEKSINELYQIFVDMATLVESQGEMLDQIEFNVGKSSAYTEEAIVELKKANKWAKRSRKLKIIIAAVICGCIILVVVIILIWLFLSGRI